ncbi:hypothetical protein TNCV_3046031 [Trichonephila clavipes]|uniref:Uncharacterized protein n=1 Tax=Trichonephila clavipes TaxID=2585209 RepID=A0A8X6RP02_TRICX|nr:hypothetical protein TNCV_3046031 [Trichonephila clavipes]
MSQKCLGTSALQGSEGLLKLVKRFEETGKLENRARAGRPCCRNESECVRKAPAVLVKLPDDCLPPSSVHNILRQILQLYPYKLQSCNELLPADTAQREAFAKWAFSKMEQDPPGFLTSCGQMRSAFLASW